MYPCNKIHPLSNSITIVSLRKHAFIIHEILAARNISHCQFQIASYCPIFRRSQGLELIPVLTPRTTSESLLTLNIDTQRVF